MKDFFLSKCFLCRTKISNSLLQSSQCVRETAEESELCYDDQFVKNKFRIHIDHILIYL